MSCGDFCDGDLANEGLVAAESDNDDFALFRMVFLWGADWLWDDSITPTDTYMNAIADLTEPTELTFNITQTINCNSTGTTGEAAGDASAGKIIETLIWTATHDDGGVVMGSSNDYTWILSFVNCTLSGNLLSQPAPMGVTLSDESAVRLNGGYVWREYRNSPVSMSDPDTYDVEGRVTLTTDGDGDGIFGNEFWTHVVNVNAHLVWNGPDWEPNGGACAGELVDLDETNTTSSGDSCAEDTDMVNDAFFQASGWFWE